MILFPEYINIRRGQYICAILGVAACPVCSFQAMSNKTRADNVFYSGLSKTRPNRSLPSLVDTAYS